VSPLSNAIGEAFVAAFLCGFVFAAGAGGSVVLLAQLHPDVRPEQEFTNGLIGVVFAIYAAMIAGVAGIITGAVYGLTPRRVRDLWMAIAIGAGVTLTGYIFSFVGTFPPLLLVGVLAFAAGLSALSAWITRKLFG
jgi:hypothetical protein